MSKPMNAAWCRNWWAWTSWRLFYIHHKAVGAAKRRAPRMGEITMNTWIYLNVHQFATETSHWNAWNGGHIWYFQPRLVFLHSILRLRWYQLVLVRKSQVLVADEKPQRPQLVKIRGRPWCWRQNDIARSFFIFWVRRLNSKPLEGDLRSHSQHFSKYEPTIKHHQPNTVLLLTLIDHGESQ